MTPQSDQALTVANLTTRYPGLPELYWTISPYNELRALLIGDQDAADKDAAVTEWARTLGGEVWRRAVLDGTTTQVKTEVKYGDVPFTVTAYIREGDA